MNKYSVNTPEGEIISVEEYMETEDYNNRLEQQIVDFLTNKKQKELIALFKNKPRCRNVDGTI